MKRTAKKALSNPVEIPVSAINPNARSYRMGKCTILVEWHSTIGYHLSISHPKRYPTWDEIAHARYKLLPASLTMAMLLPPENEYVNLDRNCFHFHEIQIARLK